MGRFQFRSRDLAGLTKSRSGSVRAILLAMVWTLTGSPEIQPSAAVNSFSNFSARDLSDTHLQVTIDYVYSGERSVDQLMGKACALSAGGQQIPGTSCLLLPMKTTSGNLTFDLKYDPVYDGQKRPPYAGNTIEVCIHLMYERPVDRKRGEDLFCQKFDYSKRWGPERPGRVTDHRKEPPTSEAGSCEISGSLKGDKKDYSTQVNLYLQGTRQPVMSVKASSGAYSFRDVKVGQYRVVPTGKYPSGRLSIGPNPSFRNVTCHPNQRHHANFAIQSSEG